MRGHRRANARNTRLKGHEDMANERDEVESDFQKNHDTCRGFPRATRAFVLSAS